MIERVAYDAYGRARHMPGADSDGDGLVQLQDLLDVIANWGSFGLADFDRSGTTQLEDQSRVIAEWNQGGLDPGELSFAAEDNIIGFSGYLFNKETRQYHVRFRVYDTGLGRWLERDPAGYTDGINLYEYVAGGPLEAMDPLGLARISRDPNVDREFKRSLPGYDGVYGLRARNARDIRTRLLEPAHDITIVAWGVAGVLVLTAVTPGPDEWTLIAMMMRNHRAGRLAERYVL